MRNNWRTTWEWKANLTRKTKKSISTWSTSSISPKKTSESSAWLPISLSTTKNSVSKYRRSAKLWNPTLTQTKMQKFSRTSSRNKYTRTCQSLPRRRRSRARPSTKSSRRSWRSAKTLGMQTPWRKSLKSATTRKTGNCWWGTFLSTAKSTTWSRLTSAGLHLS